MGRARLNGTGAGGLLRTGDLDEIGSRERIALRVRVKNTCLERIARGQAARVAQGRITQSVRRVAPLASVARQVEPGKLQSRACQVKL